MMQDTEVSSGTTATVSEPLLERLNRASLDRSFVPQTDIDWHAGTTDADFEALYPVWSLLAGSGLDAGWGSYERIAFSKYQQMNLMLVTAMLERHGLANLGELYDLDAGPAFREYLGHFIKEETYHHEMFQRAIDQIQATMPGLPPLRRKSIDRIMRRAFGLLAWVPGRRLRTSLNVTMFKFAEQVTILAHQFARPAVARESVVGRVWAWHAVDETRHLAFDDLVLERHGLGPGGRWLVRAIAAPLGLLISLTLNANELWAARQLGLRVPLTRLPSLMRRTEAPFKRKVFTLFGATLRGEVALGKFEG